MKTVFVIEITETDDPTKTLVNGHEMADMRPETRVFARAVMSSIKGFADNLTRASEAAAATVH